MVNRRIELPKIHINHDLKINTKFFNDVISGRKLFELRRSDRGFEEGKYRGGNQAYSQQADCLDVS